MLLTDKQPVRTAFLPRVARHMAGSRKHLFPEHLKRRFPTVYIQMVSSISSSNALSKNLALHSPDSP
jgi:hypothetical protein